MQQKLAGGDLQRRVILTSHARDDLLWWTSRAGFQGEIHILSSSPSLTIFTDVSLSGWWAVGMSEYQDRWTVYLDRKEFPYKRIGAFSGLEGPRMFHPFHS